jgi:hypothetical protein
MFILGFDGWPEWIKLVIDILVVIAAWLGGNATGFRRARRR